MGGPLWSEARRVRRHGPCHRYLVKLLSVAVVCSTLAASAIVLSPPDGGGGGPAAAGTATDIAPMLALPLSDGTPPLPAPLSGQSNVISSPEVPGLLPRVSPVELVIDDEGSFV